MSVYLVVEFVFIDNLSYLTTRFSITTNSFVRGEVS